MERRRLVPDEVRQAMLRGDHETLSKLGRIGAEHAAILRKLKTTEEKRKYLEAALAEASLGNISPEGDVLPPDPETIESLETALKA